MKDIMIEILSYILTGALFIGLVRFLLSPIFELSPQKRSMELLSLLREYYEAPSERVAKKILYLLPPEVKVLKLYEPSSTYPVPRGNLPKEVSRWWGNKPWTLDKVKEYRASLVNHVE